MDLHNSNILRLGTFLSRYKRIHRFLKKIYFLLNYYFLIDKNFKYQLYSDLSIETPIESDKDLFFGYYHHSSWSYDDNFIAINSVVDSSRLEINVINLSTSKVEIVDDTTLWNFQQGPMLGWFPEKHIIYYNKLINNSYKTVLYNIVSKEKKDFNFPIQAIHPKGNYYLSINYHLMSLVNKDYGYKEACNNFSNSDNGIWKCFFDTKVKPELIISLDDIKKINAHYKTSSKHELNHALFSENGTFFLFIYRYEKNRKKYSQLILVNTESLDLKIINKSFVSHMCWIDNHNIFYFGDSINGNKSYYKYNIINSEIIQIMPDNLNDGHPSINKSKKWIILDTYSDKQCNSHLYLYNLETSELLPVGKFRSDVKFQGYNRCDLHPRWNKQGTQIMIDTTFKGKRTPVIIDLKKIIERV